ncbi:FAD:protein FMN transferase [Psychroserpens ponticola]|uniref:FAD:protein FMN transferase n=1 Tax=Psychroserpens ponticola TaxID=2932268 RepID=A0ABY7RVB2_9FLAO|nr:FAD:protein FMN transferase [Psychroserpens ponticola]WCO01073.1 FAD:protein FMN transferase [Psychroserpens ponticola]
MKKITFVFVFLVIVSCKNEGKQQIETSENIKTSGPVFGTSYSVIYNSEINYEKQFDSLFAIVNQSMSTYIPNSDISKLNRNEAVVMDKHFENVFLASKKIHEATDGAFDPTIGDVVNAWSFGADKSKFLTDSTTIDSLMRFVGFDKVALKDNKVDKQSGTYIEFNAIAKGYGVDVIANFLEDKNINDYLVEIGGEIRASGMNIEKKSPWRVGLDEPRFDGEQSVLKGISLTNVGMATSGTYRKFKTDDNGNRYAHIINTKTGYPSKTNILSVSVIAKDCMTADAYATAFQAMGIENVTEFLKSHPELKVFLIFENDKNEFETLSINNFPEQ